MQGLTTFAWDYTTTEATENSNTLTLNSNNNFVPFLFMNYNGKNYNTNISLETISELFEKGVDVDELNNTISTLKIDLANKDQELKNKLAERDFDDLLKDSIATAKGRNAKAITACLDVETLKASKNQKEDIAAALKALSEREDCKMLFGEPEPNVVGTGNPIGTVDKKNPAETGNLRDALSAKYGK